MACSRESESEDDFHSVHSQDVYDQDEDNLSTVMEPPVHPVSSMQGPFEESILECADQQLDHDAHPHETTDAHARRQQILDAEPYDESWKARWKQRAEARHHPLSKLIAQIVFGLHLLRQEQAKSDEEVVKILQGHVNEVDGFLESTAEDFDLAIKDVRDRIRYMRLPMEHTDVFNNMLQDRTFRNNLIDGNDKIDKIVDRTERAMNAAMFDVHSGHDSMVELSSYLERVHNQWPANRKDIADIFDAMRGNERGWSQYLSDLKVNHNTLVDEMFALRTVVGDISKLVAAASRRNKPSSTLLRTVSSPPSHQTPDATSPDIRSKFSREDTPLMDNAPAARKPLPKAPERPSGTVLTVVSRPHPVPFDTRYEQPRQGPPVPHVRKPSLHVEIPKDAHPRTRPRRISAQGYAHNRAESITGNNGRRVSLRHSPPIGGHSPNANANGRVVRGKSISRSHSQRTTQLTRQPSESIRFQGGPRMSQNGVKEHTWTNGTAFARRLSKRLRTQRIPSQESALVNGRTISRPIDSAHSSGADKRFDATRFATAQFTGSGYKGYPYATARIGFDPDNTDFGAPLHTMEPDVIAQINGFALKKTSPAPKPKFGRTMSFRKFFRRGSIMQRATTFSS